MIRQKQFQQQQQQQQQQSLHMHLNQHSQQQQNVAMQQQQPTMATFNPNMNQAQQIIRAPATFTVSRLSVIIVSKRVSLHQGTKYCNGMDTRIFITFGADLTIEPQCICILNP